MQHLPYLGGMCPHGEIRPLLAGVFPLEEIAAAQQEFSRKHHVGKLVLFPTQV
ncbi:zinc-binding dehydrogenase [Sphaerochaeta sp. S2]|uniref:zinc-binding dehydrogenase n=1 Tax=Sphaerochaeta sp. S2 TaxID=2798868 RepID=UPI0018EA0A32|nr:zinc-binding dehydrogenase [Sphaerochaeta sp. S2]MBJ2355533.1 zinc-binding dehydrogenase [Sphaerochaeta sp. S2]